MVLPPPSAPLQLPGYQTLAPTEVGYATNQYRGAKLFPAPAPKPQPVMDERAAGFRKPRALTKDE